MPGTDESGPAEPILIQTSIVTRLYYRYVIGNMAVIFGNFQHFRESFVILTSTEAQ